MTTTTTYIRPTNAETGRPTLAVYFTAPLCALSDAHTVDLEARIEELVADIRDHLHRAGLPIRPTLQRVRIEYGREFNEQTQDYFATEIFATMAAYLTDSEPDDSRLQSLVSSPFASTRLDGVPVRAEIPTLESEAAREEQTAAALERAAKIAANPAAAVSSASAAAAEAVVDFDFDD